MGVIDEYFEIYTEKVKEYGQNTILLFQIGSFFEVYEIDNCREKIGNAKKISKILELNMVNKCGDITKSSKTRPNFIGFTISVLDKYLSILLRNGYTVVIVEQLESSSEKKGKLVKRGITKTYSPSLQPTDYTVENEFSSNLVSILFNTSEPKARSNKKNALFIQIMNVSVCCINNNNNTIEIIENEFSFLQNDIYTLNLVLENISRILYRCNPRELLISGGNINITNYFNENYENVRILSDLHVNYDLNYKNKYLRRVWENVNFGLIEPIEYFNLKELSLTNLVYILNFIEKHDSSYIKNLSIPKVSNENNNLILELNTIHQLNIVANTGSSLFDIIDYTKTAIGKRYLRNILCKPFKDPNIINNRYIITEHLGLVENLDSILDNINDIEKLHRKMGIAQLHQNEFVKLDNSYQNILKLAETLLKTRDFDILLDFDWSTNLKEFVEKYNKTFNLSKMKFFNLNSGKDQLENYFNKGFVKELDTIQNKINTLEEKRKELCLSFDNLINPERKSDFIKLVYTELEGYSFTCTKIRYQLLLEKLGKNKDCGLGVGRVRQTSNSVKFVPEELEKLSHQIINLRELLSTKITINYKNTLLEYYREYNTLFDQLKEFIQVIDVCNSNLKCSKKFNYTKPLLEDTKPLLEDTKPLLEDTKPLLEDTKPKYESFIEIKGIRHPLIESIGKKYISNDIILDSKTNGILCYGLNSSGKSTLLRAIGINLVMAQAGLFVAAKEFKFSPFDTIISQVDLTDNIFAGKSSFISEMMGLKRILQCAGPKTLVLMDEATKGTETNSSTALVSSIILELIKKDTKFFFTTHLHQIPQVQDIIDSVRGEKLKICHLSVDIKNNNIIYERKLKEGPGSALYGIEVAKSLLENNELIQKAFEIRNNLTNTTIKPIKKSIYNKKKIVEKCEICSSTKQLETHHINFQSTANENGFLDDSRHKNHLSNLCSLCKKCHDDVTYNRMIITGYKSSINGEFLDYQK